MCHKHKGGKQQKRVAVNFFHIGPGSFQKKNISDNYCQWTFLTCF